MLKPEISPEPQLLTEVERLLKDRFQPGQAGSRLPSNAQPAEPSKRMEQLTLPDSVRPRMPYTQDKYIVKENPLLVEWEREVRKFLRNLSPRHGHRVSAVMVYEWATGTKVADLVAEGGSANRDLRKINQVLRHYFGKPYMTYIMGRKVLNAYKVPPGWYVRRHRPLTLTLYADYANGVLNP